MLDYIASIYKKFIDFILKIILIAFAIGGGLIGHYIFRTENFLTVISVVIGAFIGFIIDVFIGGRIAIEIKMAENIEKLVHKAKTEKEKPIPKKDIYKEPVTAKKPAIKKTTKV